MDFFIYLWYNDFYYTRKITIFQVIQEENLFSLSSIIRVYILLSIVVMITFFVMLTSVDVLLEPVWAMISTETEIIYRHLYVTVIILSLMAIVSGVFVSIFVFDRGINKYQDFLRRFDNIEQHSAIRPSVLRFPEQDEFGNLGLLFNNFLTKIDQYDQLKTVLAKMEHEKFKAVVEVLPYPVLLIQTDTNEPYILFYNQSFRDLFLKKSVFIDHKGNTKVQYFSLEDTPVIHFTLKDEKNTPFLSEQQLNQLKNNRILWEKKHSLSDLVFTELVGRDCKKYKFGSVHCIPINNDLANVMTQMLYIFMEPSVVEKEKKTVTIEENI